jgi:hypothetical protein
VGRNAPLNSNKNNMNSTVDTLKLEQLRIALGSWTDGPKFVLMNDVAHSDLVDVVRDSKVESFVSTVEDTFNWIELFAGKIGTIFITGSIKDSEAFHWLQHQANHLDIQIFLY